MQQSRHAATWALLTLFAFAAAAGVLQLKLAEANFLPPPPELPHAVIRSDGTVEPAILPIKRAGEVYTLTANIANFTLEVQRSGIVLDGAGYVLQGNSSGKGVVLNGTRGVTVKNFKVRGFATGILLENASGSTVSDCEVNDCTLGVHLLYGARDNNVVRNRISQTNTAVLLYSACRRNLFEENVLAGNGDGVWVEFNSYEETNDYNRFVRNNMTGNTGFAMILRGCSGTLIEGNTVAYNGEGISLSGSSCNYNTIRANTFVGNGKAVSLAADSKWNTVTMNMLAANSVGVYFFNANGSEIYCNDFLYNTRQVENAYVNDSGRLFGLSVNAWSRNAMGNYWSDYARNDVNGDDIGDAAYVIDELNVDRYPLMKPCTSQALQMPSLSMPLEYVNYTVTRVNGTLYAVVDGVYPMKLLSWQPGKPLALLYPTPLGTTDITIKLDGQTISWSNYTEAHPEAWHYTALGEWPMIQTVVEPPSATFQLSIHYMHPVAYVNGSYTVLYDLNIAPYLSPASPRSTACFRVRLETAYADFKVYCTGTEQAWTPLEHTLTHENSADVFTFNLTSAYDAALPGDVVFTFTENSAVPVNPTAFILAALFAVTAAAAYGSRKLKHYSKISPSSSR